MAEAGRDLRVYKPLEEANAGRGFLVSDSPMRGRMAIRSVPSNPSESLMVRLIDKPAVIDVQSLVDWRKRSVLVMGLRLDPGGGLTGFRDLVDAVENDPQIFLGYWGITDPEGRKPGFALGYRYDQETGLGHLAQAGEFEAPDIIPDLSRDMPRFKKAPFAPLTDPAKRRAILEMTGLPETVDPERTLKWLVEGMRAEADGAVIVLSSETFAKHPLLPPTEPKPRTP